jgi:hypothetical protein
MGNCYSVCGADFENTMEMVASARGLTASEVKKTLERLKKLYGSEEEYVKLRNRLPKDFPM